MDCLAELNFHISVMVVLKKKNKILMLLGINFFCVFLEHK